MTSLTFIFVQYECMASIDHHQVNGAKMTLLGGSLNPQGVLQVLIYMSGFDYSNRLRLDTRWGLTGQ